MYLTTRRLPDGTERPDEAGMPKPCRRCGKVPEFIIEVVEQVVEDRDQLARLQADDLDDQGEGDTPWGAP